MTTEKKASQEQRAGYWLRCPICEGDKFHRREGMLNTRLGTLFDLDWTNPSADCFICENCCHILWFYGEKEKL